MSERVEYLQVLHDAQALDDLADGRRPHVNKALEDEALELLFALRQDVDVPRPAGVSAEWRPHLVADEARATPVGGGRRPVSRRLRLGVAATLCAAVISTSGVAAAAVSHPGDPLYRLRAATFGRTADDPHAAETLISRANRLLTPAVSGPVGAGEVRRVTRARALLALAQAKVARLPAKTAAAPQRTIDQQERRADELLRSGKPVKAVRGVKRVVAKVDKPGKPGKAVKAGKAVRASNAVNAASGPVKPSKPVKAQPGMTPGPRIVQRAGSGRGGSSAQASAWRSAGRQTL